MKLGGTTLADQAHVLEDVATVARKRPVVVVHGGGKRMTEWLARLGVESRFEGGLRVTDAAALEVAAAVLRGVVNSELVSALRDLGVDAVGLSGIDGGMLVGERVPNIGLVAHVVGPQARPARRAPRRRPGPGRRPAGARRGRRRVQRQRRRCRRGHRGRAGSPTAGPADRYRRRARRRRPEARRADRGRDRGAHRRRHDRRRHGPQGQGGAGRARLGGRRGGHRRFGRPPRADAGAGGSDVRHARVVDRPPCHPHRAPRPPRPRADR